jgi:hypothetical protein
VLAPQGPALKPTARLLRRPQAPAQPDRGPQRAQAIHLGFAAELWAQAIHLESQRNFGLRPVTSDSQRNFGLRPFTSDSQRKFGLRPLLGSAIHPRFSAEFHLLGSGHFLSSGHSLLGSGHSPRMRSGISPCGLRPVTSDSQRDFGLRPLSWAQAIHLLGSGHFWAQATSTNDQH